MQHEEKNSLRIKRCFNYPDGTPCLICSAQSVRIEGVDKIGKFYDKVRDSALDFCERCLIRVCAPPNEYSYRLVCKTAQAQEGMTVTLKATFTDRTQRKIISSAEYTHKWDNRGYLRGSSKAKKH